jgi:uncharacterized protein YndB with AHSA1/START domain
MNPDTRTTPTVQITRIIPAPPDRVYRAWLDPDLVMRWMAPGSLAATRVEINERVGGDYRVWQAADGVDGGGFDAELLELVADHRIVWRWGFVGPDRRHGPVYDSRLTVTLEEAPGGTRLNLVHERLDALAEARPDVADNVSVGWEDVLGKLDGALADDASTPTG